MLSKERLRSVKQACSRTIQTSGAIGFGRGAHHRRCAREGLTGPMMPRKRPKLQAAGPISVRLGVGLVVVVEGFVFFEGW